MKPCTLTELRRPQDPNRPFPNAGNPIQPSTIRTMLSIATKELALANEEITKAKTGECVRLAEDARAFWQGYQGALRELDKLTNS